MHIFASHSISESSRQMVMIFQPSHLSLQAIVHGRENSFKKDEHLIIALFTSTIR